MTLCLIFACIMGACTGLLFGYDIGVAGGVAAMLPFQERFFPNVLQASATASTDPFCRTTDAVLQLFVASIFLTGIVGALAGSWICGRVGRKAAIVAGGCFFLVGSVMMATAPVFAVLLTGRLCVGFAIGTVVQSGPVYLAEVAPAHLRGRLGFTFQLCVTCGILMAQVLNYLLSDLHVGWCVSLGMEAVPALILLASSIMAPDTPASLARQGWLERCKQTLGQLRGTLTAREYHAVEAEYAELMATRPNERDVQGDSAWQVLLADRALRPQLGLTVFLSIANQLTLINGVMFFMPIMIHALLPSGGSGTPMLTTIAVGVVNVIATVGAVFAVDRFGRRTLLIGTTVGAMACLVALGAILQFGMDMVNGTLPLGSGVGFVVAACLLVVCHACGIGPLAWLMCAEIQPTEKTRAAGAGLAVVVNFGVSFAIGQAFLSLFCALKPGVFFLFAGLQALVLVATIALVPETRGISMNSVSEALAKHRAWRQFCAVTHPVPVSVSASA
jgi:sugar porter (SP) family MFS transporter